MDSSRANQISTEFKSALSEILPDLYQVIKHYQVSGVLKTRLHLPISAGCYWVWDGTAWHRICTHPSMQFVPELLSFGATSEPEDDLVQQFCTDFASKLFEQVAPLTQSVQQTDESFEVHFSIDPATVNFDQPVVCRWISDDILKCSTS
jgi:hypothetical protein